MPRKRRVNKAKEQLTDAQWDYLCDKPMPANFETFVLEIDFHRNTHQLWDLHRDAILTEHIKENPGTRPALWWRYDAPRLPIGTFPGHYRDGQLPEPRLLVGGSGTHVAATSAAYAYGLPTAWIDIDEDDPPTFENQAAYLKRHGLLLAGEERRADFEPDAV
jgi:hypothetical protein